MFFLVEVFKSLARNSFLKRDRIYTDHPPYEQQQQQVKEDFLSWRRQKFSSNQNEGLFPYSFKGHGVNLGMTSVVVLHLHLGKVTKPVVWFQPWELGNRSPYSAIDRDESSISTILTSQDFGFDTIKLSYHTPNTNYQMDR